MTSIPYKPLASNTPALEVQAVSLDWKWLFIYPDQRIASVNQLVVPAGVPIHFSLTSASVMNAFFIPQLGSMIYTMNGMTTQLNLQRGRAGTFRGLSSHYSGDGFSDMHFDVQAVPPEQFAAWIEATRNSGPTLDAASYAALAQQSINVDAIHLRRGRSRICSRRSSHRNCRRGPARRPGGPTRTYPRGRSASMLGKLTWAAIPFDQPIPLIAGAVVGLAIIARARLDHAERLAPLSLAASGSPASITSASASCTSLLAMVMLLRGFTDAIMMRSQQALAFRSEGYLPPEHYDQIFSAHGTLMIFFVAMPFVIGLMNFVMPLQLGIRDVAFPTLNSVSFWLTATGALLVNISLVVGEFARTGWLPYPPLSEMTYSPGVGVDYYLWSLQISGVGTLLTGINFVTTILKLHAPGMTYMRMPMFCWTALASNLLIVAAFPDPDRDAGDAAAGPLPRLPFLHQRRRRQHDDVHEPDLGVGTSGGLHPDPAGVRRILGSGRDLFRQAAVRLPVDGAWRRW